VALQALLHAQLLVLLSLQPLCLLGK